MTIDTLPDDGVPQRVTVRPARTQDTRLIQAYIRSLSPASRRNRFLGPLNELSAIALHGRLFNDWKRRVLPATEGHEEKNST